MQKSITGDFKPFKADFYKLGIVTAEFNSHITHELESSALMRAEKYKIFKENITVIRVAGAIEIPLVLDRMAKTGEYQALLAVGCVIRGDTTHFDYVCKFVSEGILRVQLDYGQPIGYSVLTCENMKQAEARLALGADNLDAVLHQAKALDLLSGI